MPAWTKWTLGAVCAAILAAGAAFVVLHYRHTDPASQHPAAWNSDAIKATFAGIQVREIDASNAAVIFFYDLENTTDFDYRLDNGPQTNFLSRLKSDGSLSSEDQPRLDHPAFVPARNRTHIGVELVRPFPWPGQDGSYADQQLREFVRRQTANLAGFVLFDENTRYQVELRGGWPDMEPAARASAN